MSKAVRIHANGGPEAMVFEDVEIPAPGPGEVRLRHSAIGLNFLDVYFRSGLYPSPAGMPLVPGSEGAGVVLDVGAGVTALRPGDRVAYVSAVGAYSTERLMPADRLVAIPDTVSYEQAAASLLKGLTVEYLLRRTYAVKPGDTVLYHAAAGGVGLLFGQWAKHIGATTIGTAGSPEKVAMAKANGFDHVIDYSKDSFVEAVKDITGGRKCDVVYDSVGKDTFEGSLDCLRPRGLFVSFGQSSGPIPPFSTSVLSQKGSLYMTRPTLFTYIADRKELETAAAALFGLIGTKVLTIAINQRYALADAGQAHRDLEARKTTGMTILIP